MNGKQVHSVGKSLSLNFTSRKGAGWSDGPSKFSGLRVGNKKRNNGENANPKVAASGIAAANLSSPLLDVPSVMVSFLERCPFLVCARSLINAHQERRYLSVF